MAVRERGGELTDLATLIFSRGLLKVEEGGEELLFSHTHRLKLLQDRCEHLVKPGKNGSCKFTHTHVTSIPWPGCVGRAKGPRDRNISHALREGSTLTARGERKQRSPHRSAQQVSIGSDLNTGSHYLSLTTALYTCIYIPWAGTSSSALEIRRVMSSLHS